MVDGSQLIYIRNEPIMAQDKKTTPTATSSSETPASPAKKDPKIAKPEPKRFQQDTLTTGLSDYGFWAQQVKEEREARKEPDPPFRRGRIWA
jgi:cyanobactin cluster PatC/TenC/TruC protein